MKNKKKIICEKPSFEIYKVDNNGTEQIEIYSLREFSDQLPEITMDRRRFMGFSVFAGATSFAAALSTRAYGAEEAVRFASIPREMARISSGEIVRIDTTKNIICIKESSDSEEICINIIPETEIEVDKPKQKISQLRVGEKITVRYTIGFTGERTAISISSPITVVTTTPTTVPTTKTHGCGGSTSYCS